MIERVYKLPKKKFQGIEFFRIKALYKTYGEKTELYIQKKNGRITALFGSYQSGFSLCAENNADFSELESFFKFLKVEIFCDIETAEKLEGFNKTTCNIMQLKTFNKGEISHGKLCDVYYALKKGEDGDIVLPSFDMWYTDFCLRFNHTAAEYALLNGAVAVCGFMTNEASLITGVAVDPNIRGLGLGKKVVTNLVTAIKEKYKNSEIYAVSSNKNIPFYENCGFVLVGLCAVLGSV